MNEEQQPKEKQKGKKGKKKDSKKTQDSNPLTTTQMENKKTAKISKKPQQLSPQKKKDEKKGAEKKGKQPLIKEDTESLLEYFKSTNRPYTVNYLKDTLFLKLSTLQKNIDILIQKNDIVMKEVGSTKVFLINQALMPNVNQQDLDLLACELEQKTEEYKQLANLNNKFNEQIKNLQRIPTLNELQEQKVDLISKINQIKNKLIQYQDENYKMASIEETQKVEAENENMKTLCKKRKKTYQEAIGSILSESDLTVQQFEKIVGIFRD